MTDGAPKLIECLCYGFSSPCLSKGFVKLRKGEEDPWPWRSGLTSLLCPWGNPENFGEKEGDTLPGGYPDRVEPENNC